MLRGGKQHPLYARVAAAGATPAVVVPADAEGGLCVGLRSSDCSWEVFLAAGRQRGGCSAAPHVADPGDTCCVLFSSGTTGSLLQFQGLVLHWKRMAEGLRSRQRAAGSFSGSASPLIIGHWVTSGFIRRLMGQQVLEQQALFVRPL